MIRCEETTRAGTQCQRQAQQGKALCIWHDPTLAAQRRYNASLGGKAKGSSIANELREIRGELYTLVSDIRCARVPAASGAVAVQAYNAIIRALSEERKT